MRWIKKHLLMFAALAVLAYMLLPNVVVAVFSFNDPRGRYNYEWNEFSASAWLNPCGNPGICEALGLSLRIGIVASVVATILGTLVAFALGRHRFRVALRRTCSSSCRWPLPRSSWARAC